MRARGHDYSPEFLCVDINPNTFQTLLTQIVKSGIFILSVFHNYPEIRVNLNPVKWWSCSVDNTWHSWQMINFFYCTDVRFVSIAFNFRFMCICVCVYFISSNILRMLQIIEKSCYLLFLCFWSSLRMVVWSLRRPRNTLGRPTQ